MSSREPEESRSRPPDEWWTDSYAKGNVRVNFYDIYGKIESIAATWSEDDIFEFELDETPLLVNGVSIGDIVEVEWRLGEVTPYFVRVNEKSPYRTVRVELNKSDADNPRLKEFLRNSTSSPRIEGDVLAFSVFEDTNEVKANLFEEFGLWGKETDAAEADRPSK
jgi:hypothetical protein